MSEVIENLRVLIGLDPAEFEGGLGEVQGLLRDLQAEFNKFGDAWKRVGQDLTTKVTLPIVGLGAAAIKVAGDFEGAMGAVQISTQASTAEFAAMRAQAIAIGTDTVFGASEAAGAMDDLAKTGLSTADILGGAARATANLAAAVGSNLSPAATAISDVMSQFKLKLAQLPDAVNQITGAVNESKFSFNDYQLAIAQAGGVAGGVGVSFTDFNTTIAATSSLFASGSDAGTSFKTFLINLVPQSKGAAAAIAQYGLTFFDAAGQMKPMADIAEQLRVKLSGLSDEAKNDVLKTIFGTDALRTAIGLMDQGAAGLDKIAGAIGRTDAAAQSAQRMTGFNAQLATLAGAFETLAIAVADTGLLTAITGLVTTFAGAVSSLAAINPTLLKVIVGFAALSAAVGPLMLVMAPLAGLILPLFVARLGLVGLAISGLLNPVGTAVALFARFALGLSFTGILSAITSGLAAFGATAVAALSPILLPLAALAAVGALIYYNWDKIAPVLAAVGARIQEALGPQITAVIDRLSVVVAELANKFSEQFGKISALFTQIASGPIGTTILWIGEKLTILSGTLVAVLGETALGVIGAAISIFGGVLEALGNVLLIVANVLTGDFGGAMKAAQALVTGVQTSMVAAFNALKAGGLAALSQLVAGVRNFMGVQLDAIWESARQKIEAVKGYFFGLYDAVVGHSYVPDMVDGIRDQFARLDGVMVSVAKVATGKTGDAFRDLANRTKGLIDSLFPEQAAVAALQAKYADLDAALAAKLITPAVYSAARDRLRAEMEKLAAQAHEAMFPGGGTELGNTGNIKKELEEFGASIEADLGAPTKKVTDQVMKDFADMARGVLNSVSGLADAIKGGDFFDILDGILGLLSSIGGVIPGGLKIGPAVFGGGGYAGDSIPGFATGGSFKVGGVSGIDKNLVRFRATKGEMVNITKGGQAPARGVTNVNVHINAQDAVLTSQVRQWVAEGVQTATNQGAALAINRSQRAQRSALA